MPIVPLPQFEADLAQHLREEEDRQAYLRLRPPTTIVVRFGRSLMVGEFPYDGEAKPGCGSKIVVRTHRGTELGDMLTTTCENAGCAKSVTRKEMLEYIENSGGADYPFFDARHNKHGVKGRALRIATAEDLAIQSRLAEEAVTLRKRAQELSRATGVNVKVVEAEPILGGETLTVYYLSEERVEFGPLLAALKHEYPHTRVELRQVGARDEARLTADYERCGQYCCCKNFLKVLKPVSMRSAKTQKATLDPLKISGRCGRLMCCLRYEDKTYSELKKNLPNRKSRVGTPHGDGIVLDSQILTQLVLVLLDDTRTVAVPVEELTAPGLTPAQAPVPASAEPRPAADRPARRERREEPRRPAPEPASEGGETASEADAPAKSKRKRRKKKRSGAEAPTESPASAAEGAASPAETDTEPKPVVGRRRRRGGESLSAPSTGPQPTNDDADGDEGDAGEAGPEPSGEGPKRRRRRRRPGGGGSGSAGSPGPDGSDSGPGAGEA